MSTAYFIPSTPNLAAVKQVFAPLPPMAAKILTVLLTLARPSSTQVLVEISIEKLTDLAGCSRRTCCSALSALKHAGFIAALPRHYLFPTTYMLTLPAPLQPQPTVQPIAPISQNPNKSTLVQPAAPISQIPSQPTIVQPIAPISQNPNRSTLVQPAAPISQIPSQPTIVQPAAPISQNPNKSTLLQPAAPVSQFPPQTATVRAAQSAALQAAALRAISTPFR